MCIPIELDVPVVTRDRREIGIAREILCSCPGDLPAGASDLRKSRDAASTQNDLWLRVTRAARPDLFVPFGELAETRPDGVTLRVLEAEIVQHHWERPPARLPIPA